jgi:hypothetical protein
VLGELLPGPSLAEGLTQYLFAGHVLNSGIRDQLSETQRHGAWNIDVELPVEGAPAHTDPPRRVVETRRPSLHPSRRGSSIPDLRYPPSQVSTPRTTAPRADLPAATHPSLPQPRKPRWLGLPGAPETNPMTMPEPDR